MTPCARLFLGVGLALLMAPIAASARDYSVDPSTATEGSWPSIPAALKSGKLQGGDRLLLAPGDYGSLRLNGLKFDPPLEIRSGPGGRAHVGSIFVKNSAGITIADLDVWPNGKHPEYLALVQTEKNTSQIHFEGLDIRSTETAMSYLDWSQQDWLAKYPARGVRLQGPDQALVNSTLTGISNGIISAGARAQVIGNEVRGFSKDGMRGFGDGSVFRGNTIRDCVKVDDNHDDAFQSWNPRPGPDGPEEIRNITLEANTIIEWTGPPDHPLRCTLQGFGLFRGIYRDWVIQNNLIAISAFHGIAVYGGIGVKILNNTVVHVDGSIKKSPWIMITDSPGVTSRDNLVDNNLAMAFKVDPAFAGRHNQAMPYPARTLRDILGRDYRPKPDSAVIDAGDPANAPPHDITGTPRPQGAGPDLGAYETD